jgi:hypothetical protein
MDGYLTTHKPAHTIAQRRDSSNRFAIASHDDFLTGLGAAQQVGQAGLRISSGDSGGHGLIIDHNVHSGQCASHAVSCDPSTAGDHHREAGGEEGCCDADCHGNGTCELTNAGGVRVHGFHAALHP